MRKLTCIVLIVAAAALSACTSSRSAPPASQPSTSLPMQNAVATTTSAKSQPALNKLGEPFTLGSLRVTVLALQDPFPSTPQVQPAPGNRLVSIKYEVVSQSSESKKLSELPAIEVRDSTGAGYRSEHGRVSVIGGSGAPGELAAGKSMESNAVFEVPAGASGLVVTFRSPLSPSEQPVLVTVN